MRPAPASADGSDPGGGVTPEPAEDDSTTARTVDRLAPSAASISGLGELVDFILPLWAAATIGLSPALIGAVMAVELATAVCFRPLAGRWADRLDRRLLAAGGGTVFATGLLILALAGSAPLVFLASALLGLGSAFFWVPLRAMVAESSEQQRAFSRLTSAEGTGIWVVYIIALSALPLIDFKGVFAIAAAAALGAALYLALGAIRPPAPRRSAPMPGHAPPLRGGQARLLVFVALVALVESAASIYLLLRFQQEFSLDLMEIVWFYLPGLIVYSVVPQWGAAVTQAWGERTLVLLCLGLTVAGIFLVTLAPEPWMLAVGWALLSWSWGWLDPLQQTTATRVLPGGLGRAMGRYEASTLVGGALGALAGGLTLQSGSPLWVSLAALVVMLGTLPLTRFLYSPSSTSPPSVPTLLREVRSPHQEWRKALEHLTVYILVQILLAVAELSWVTALVTTGSPWGGLNGQEGSVNTALYVGSLIWGAVVVLDLAISGIQARRSRRPTGRQHLREVEIKQQERS